MLRQLLAWDADGNVVAHLDHMVAKDEDGNVIGLVDFGRHEEVNGRLRDIWENSKAVGSGTWPEWVGAHAYDFKVELDPNPKGQRAKITALVHRESGHRRDRAEIEAAIAERIADARAVTEAKGIPWSRVRVDLRDLLGGPDRPLRLDEAGRTRPRVKSAPRPALPFVPAKGTGRGRPLQALDPSPEQSADDEGKGREQDAQPKGKAPDGD